MTDKEFKRRSNKIIRYLATMKEDGIEEEYVRVLIEDSRRLLKDSGEEYSKKAKEWIRKRKERRGIKL